jgi:riboflavin kinase/FMN adenylyltransferase
LKTLEDISQLSDFTEPLSLAIGFFDGLHCGHGAVLQRAMDYAERNSGQAWALTFDSHPRQTVEPRKVPSLLTSTNHKLRLLDRYGIYGCVILSFTRELANQSPEDFVRQLSQGAPSLGEIVVGQNWKFGKGRAGNPEILTSLSKQYDISVSVVDPVIWDGEPISSTRIREAVITGSLKEAADMLGRSFSILGTVAHGRGMGHQLGFPTANIEGHGEITPPHGVYAVRAAIEGDIYNAVLNIGVCPTFDTSDSPEKVTIEVHIPGIDRDLYGLEVEVSFEQKLRDEEEFPSSTELKTQIAKDIENATNALREFPHKNV